MSEHNSDNATGSATQDSGSGETVKTREVTPEDAKGLKALKRVFAMEYVLQGLANPFQGITYQPFFRHFTVHYGLTESATQVYFSQSYLAWSFKPLIGFVIDAIGKTRTILLSLLSMAILCYLLTPLVDVSVQLFFYFMFFLSVILASTDVAVDRATVVAGEEEAQATGQSRATTVGLNQAICWTAIYGTGIVAAVSGGWIADNVDFHLLMLALAIVPLVVLGSVYMLPKDKAVRIPLSESLLNFWNGLNTGPVLWIIVFYFLFHFQPAMGTLWTNYMLEDLLFTQTQAGIGDGASNLGLFVGVILFVVMGVKAQDKMGLRKVFKIYILLSIAINMSQYLVVDPWFSRITGGLGSVLPFADSSIRLGFLCVYNFFQATMLGLIRMSSFSLVGAVIPVAAAGSLFAGFMSVTNLAYSFSYSSGAWLYENGLNFSVLRGIQEGLFGIDAMGGNTLSIQMLILGGSLAYLLSFVAAGMLPDLKRTLSGEVQGLDEVGHLQHAQLPEGTRKKFAYGAALSWLGLFLLSFRVLDQNVISSILLAFFLMAFVRKIMLDRVYRRWINR